MTQEQLQMMECLRVYITNTPATQVFVYDCQQWQSLYELAAAHRMSAVVYDTLGRLPQFCLQTPVLKSRWTIGSHSTFCVPCGACVEAFYLRRLRRGVYGGYPSICKGICRRAHIRKKQGKYPRAGGGSGKTAAKYDGALRHLPAPWRKITCFGQN